MYFFQNTGTLHLIKDSRANGLSLGNCHFWGILGDFQPKNFWGFLARNLEFLGDFFSSLGWQPCQGDKWLTELRNRIVQKIRVDVDRV
jgi:hypothetical protein